MLQWAGESATKGWKMHDHPPKKGIKPLVVFGREEGSRAGRRRRAPGRGACGSAAPKGKTVRIFDNYFRRTVKVKSGTT